MKYLSFLLVLGLLIAGCTQSKMAASVESKVCGTFEGQDIHEFTLTNAKGMQVNVIEYGGIITKIIVPDKNGEMGDVVLGFDTAADYVKSNPYFGCIIGRYGNRIGGASFELNDETYTLAKNDGNNSLHGGLKGFDKKLWIGQEMAIENGVAVELAYTSPDGEEGFPGNLETKVTYTLTDENELRIDYFATTDKATICNLTNHTYFNLKDGGKSSAMDHVMQLNCEYFTPVDGGLIPTGELVSVENTPFDFREPKALAKALDLENEQIKLGGGIDHNYVIDRKTSEVQLIGEVYEPTTGRVMEIYTTEPGVQCYSGNFLNGSVVGKGGVAYQKRTAFCLETQHYPDSPNKPDFPTTTLNPGEEYKSTTVYKFLTI